MMSDFLHNMDGKMVMSKLADECIMSKSAPKAASKLSKGDFYM